MKPLTRLLNRYSRAVNISKATLMVLVSIVFYMLIILLFLSPKSYHISSLVYPAYGSPRPATVVGLLDAVLSGATSALVTMCVEHSMWYKVMPRHSTKGVKRPITVSESHRLAQWSMSASARVLYAINGKYFLLRFGGLFLVATSIVNAVLLNGISQGPQTINTTKQPGQGNIWTGWLDVANDAYNGGDFSDIPGSVAALATLSNLSTPASSICGNQSCHVEAFSAALRADCASHSQLHPGSLYNLSNFQNETYCSSYNKKVCATLSSGAPYTYVNFTGGPTTACELNQFESCDGDFTVIFGAFINNTWNSRGPFYLNIVDCIISWGNVTIIQNATNSPFISNGSYVKDSSTRLDSWMSPLSRIYNENNGMNSPFYFTGSTGTGDQADSLYRSAIGTLLVTPKANTSTEIVAQAMQAIFNNATLLAFSRSPLSSDLIITTTVIVYIYDPTYLSILLVPLLATVLSVWGRIRVSGSNTMIGYDPIQIARMGPVRGLPDRVSGEVGVGEVFEKWVVEGVKETNKDVFRAAPSAAMVDD